jgi:nucleotide-binding universal stress UspA family protein
LARKIGFKSFSRALMQTLILEVQEPMNAFKKILVAVAFSRYTPTLLAYASEMAQNLNAELLVANVINIRNIEAISSVESMGYSVDTEAYRKSLEEERRNEIQKLLKDLPVAPEKVRVIFKVGHPFEKLLQMVQEEGVDLVVMGLKGRTDLEHVLLGSVAEKMFRHSPVPVLSCRWK